MDLDMYIVQAGTPATDVASATRVRRRSDTADRDDKSRRRTRPRVAAPRSLAERLVLRVVTLCSGIEAVIQGYENLRVPHVHAAACDNNKHVQQMIRRNFSPNVIFPVLRLLKNNVMPVCDMIWAGSPCQPFSVQGRNAGCTGETHTCQ